MYCSLKTLKIDRGITFLEQKLEPTVLEPIVILQKSIHKRYRVKMLEAFTKLKHRENESEGL